MTVTTGANSAVTGENDAVTAGGAVAVGVLAVETLGAAAAVRGRVNITDPDDAAVESVGPHSVTAAGHDGGGVG